VVTLRRRGTLAQDALAAQLMQPLAEEVASKRRRANATRSCLSVEKLSLLGVKTDRYGVGHVI
jgi:hypothetical protein